MHFHGRSNIYSRIDRAYTSTNLRMGVKIAHKINTVSDHFQTIVIKREPTNFKKRERPLDTEMCVTSIKEYMQHIKELWEN